MMARSFDSTVKIPEKKKSTTKPTIRILTMTKLLRRASASAREPDSSSTAEFGLPVGEGGVVPAATCSVVRGGSCFILSKSLMAPAYFDVESSVVARPFCVAPDGAEFVPAMGLRIKRLNGDMFGFTTRVAPLLRV